MSQWTILLARPIQNEGVMPGLTAILKIPLLMIHPGVSGATVAAMASCFIQSKVDALPKRSTIVFTSR